MLRLMLTSHPNIVVPPEGGFIVLLGLYYGNYTFKNEIQIEEFIDRLFKIDKFQDWCLDKDELIPKLNEYLPRSYPTIIDEIYKFYTEKHFPGKKRWGDKSTGLYMEEYLPVIHKLFPNSKFIHIYRDGRSIAASYRGVPHLSSDIEHVALEWSWNINNITNFGHKIGGDAYYEIKYEDLVNNPEEELVSICEFVDESYDSSMLDFPRYNRELVLEPKRHLLWKGLTLQAVSKTRIDSWKNELTQEEINLFEAIAGKVLRDLGYSCTNTTPKEVTERIKLKSKTIFYNVKRRGKSNVRPCYYRLKTL